MVDLLIPGPEGKIEAKYTHNARGQTQNILTFFEEETHKK